MSENWCFTIEISVTIPQKVEGEISYDLDIPPFGHVPKDLFLTIETHPLMFTATLFTKTQAFSCLDITVNLIKPRVP